MLSNMLNDLAEALKALDGKNITGCNPSSCCVFGCLVFALRAVVFCFCFVFWFLVDLIAYWTASGPSPVLSLHVYLNSSFAMFERV